MRSPELDEVPLAALEAAAAPVAVVGTILVVVLGGLVATAVRVAGDAAGVAGTGLAVATGAVAVLTLLALLGAVAGAVEAYRRRFERTDGGRHVLLSTAVPATVALLALAYGTLAYRTLSPPWWALGVAALAANVAALRTAAMYSRSSAHRREGTLVGVVAALPATLGLAVAVTRRLLGTGDVALAGRLLDAWLAAAGVPRVGLLTVLVPAVVAGAYAVHRARNAGQTVSNVAQTSLPRSSKLPEPDVVPDHSLTAAEYYLRKRVPYDLPNLRGTDDADGGGEPSPRTPDRGPVQPPVSASSSSRGRRHGGRGSASADGGSASASSSSGSGPGGGSSGRSRSSSGSSGSGAGSSGSGSSGGSSGSSGSGAGSGGSGSGSSRSGSSGSSSGSSSSGSSSGTGGSASSSGGSAGSSGGSSDGTGSDTRIFTGDFGSYGEESADTCPACEEELPSDGVYTFCPFCGEEL